MPKLRASALVAVGAIVVHQGRFALAPDSGAPVDGHGYLPLAALLTGGLLALAGGRFLASLVRARRGG